MTRNRKLLDALAPDIHAVAAELARMAEAVTDGCDPPSLRRYAIVRLAETSARLAIEGQRS